MTKYFLLLTSIVMVTSCHITNTNKQVRAKTNVLSIDKDSISLPYLFKVISEETKVYLTQIDTLDMQRSYVQNFLSYDYLKDSIGADDLFLEYTLRKESIYKLDENKDITETTSIVRYVPIDEKDYYVSEIAILYDMIEPAGCAEIVPRWYKMGLLSKKENDEQQKILEIYQTQKVKRH